MLAQPLRDDLRDLIRCILQRLFVVRELGIGLALLLLIAVTALTNPRFLSAQSIKDQFSQGGALQRLLLRYTQALMTQMTQTAVCNRHHVLEQQLCRWLLLSLDRLPSNELVMTQQLIAIAGPKATTRS